MFLFLIITSVIAFLFLDKVFLGWANNKRVLKEKRRFETDSCIRLHMVSETEWVTQGQGVHTAFIELIKLLAHESDLSIVVNNAGTGNIFHSHTYGPYYFLKGYSYKGRRILTRDTGFEQGNHPFLAGTYALYEAIS